MITIEREGRLEGAAWRQLMEAVIQEERDTMGGMGPFERTWVLERCNPKERMRRFIEGVNEGLAVVRDGVICPVIRGAGSSPFATVVGQPVGPPTSFTAIGTTNVETNLWTPNIWTPIPQNDMIAGRFYKVDFGGIFSTSSAAPTSTWTPRAGQSATPASNVTLGATTGTTMIASLANVPFFGHFTLQLRSLGLAAGGATGTGNGFVILGGLTTAAGIVQAMGGTVATTIDNTAASGLIISQTWGTNAAANTLTCQWVTPSWSLN